MVGSEKMKIRIQAMVSRELYKKLCYMEEKTAHKNFSVFLEALIWQCFKIKEDEERLKDLIRRLQKENQQLKGGINENEM